MSSGQERGRLSERAGQTAWINIPSSVVDSRHEKWKRKLLTFICWGFADGNQRENGK